MGRERVDSFTEAKALSGEHKKGRHRKIGPDIHAGQAQGHGAAGQNMDGISADFDQLVVLDGQLQALRDELVGHQAKAAELTGPLTDGSSPVTAPMRKAFLQRADVEEGVGGTLAQYIEELDGVRAAIANTLGTYQGVDGDAVSRLNQATNVEGTEL
jgi:hypothetical protein